MRVIKATHAKRYHITMPTNASILAEYQTMLQAQLIKPSLVLEKLLQIRSVRTLSGIAPICVLTKPYPCPGRCIYCPSEANMPKSYMDTEPGAMRALQLQFDPYLQVTKRIEALERNGHRPEKCELIILGGTWSAYQPDYQEWFMRRCYEGFNGDVSTTLDEAKRFNETAKYRVIGCTIETRPDHITEAEVKRLRWLGATRVQMGVQTVNIDVLQAARREQTNEQVKYATQLLKEAGIKITYHMMQNLPGATPTTDLQDIKTIFTDSSYQPDHLKIYPCVVVKSAPLYQVWQKEEYQPYDLDTLTNLLIAIKTQVPRYVRIERLVRDIPANSIAAGNVVTNLRQIMQLRKVQCKCIRCREPRGDNTGINEAQLFIEQYTASAGQEYFISYENPERTKLFGFMRLRLQNIKQHWYGVLQDTAIIRELHIYGRLVPIADNSNVIQHKGFGKKLMLEAERIAQEQNFQKIAVIAGVGVREYYEKLGYRLDEEYMIKNLH